MKRITLCVLLVLILGSCQDNEAPISEDIIANILSDIHMAEAYAQLVPKDEGGYMTKNQDTLRILYSHIYKKHKVDTGLFNSALVWYKERPKAFDKVYEKVLNQLSIRKESAKDSIVEYSDSTQTIIKDTL